MAEEREGRERLEGEGQGGEPARGLRGWLDGAPLPPRWHLGLGLLMPAALLVAAMWRVRPFTIDDAYISFRYARNLARGLGLVFNAGERIEGYTNFLWTVLLAGGVRLGLDPDALAKVLGGAAALGALGAAYLLERRVLALRGVPALSPWLLASSIAFSGYAVFGLETALFVFLVLAGTELLFRENDRESAATLAAGSPPPLAWLGTREGFPFSGLLFGLAGLTRPEAPLFLGIPMLFLGRRFFGRQNLLRGVVFVAPIALHMLWRHGYYGTWLPNTLSAKTGNLRGQLEGGFRYLREYSADAWPALLLALYGLCVAIVTRHRRALCLGAIALAVLGYVLLVGGDWMPYYRFLAAFEPYAFILAGLGGRALGDFLITWSASRRAAGRPSPALAALAALAALTLVAAIGTHRSRNLQIAQRRILRDEKVFWDSAAGGVARWFLDHGQPGEIGVGDIGYIAYATDYPILDLLGLVDPVISTLPGGYTNKTGPGYVQRVFQKQPQYFVFVGQANGCSTLPFHGQEKLRRDARFQRAYRLATQIRHSKSGYWCIFSRLDEGALAPAPAGGPGAEPEPVPASPPAPAPDGRP